MFRLSTIILCLLLGSVRSLEEDTYIFYCWKGSQDPTKPWSMTDKLCDPGVKTCSRSAYHNLVEYGCGTEACEGLVVANTGCQERDCTVSLCNGRAKCYVGSRTKESNMDGLSQEVCPADATECSQASTKLDNGTTLYEYYCGNQCSIDNAGADDCMSCKGRLCNGALNTIPSLAILAIILAWAI